MKKHTKKATRTDYINRIVRALDREQASLRLFGDDDQPLAAGIIYDRSDRFSHLTHEGARAVLLAYAQHAPMDELEDMAARADSEFSHSEWYDVLGWYESYDFAPIFESEAAAMKAAATAKKAGVS